MARKGKKDNDAELDFFGDSNVDWLSDEEDQTRAPTAPPAPPPPPPDLVSAVPAAARAGETDFPSPQVDAKDRKALANAPTLIFSSVPTLPPMPSPLPKAPPPPPPAQHPPASETLSPSPLDPLVADALGDTEAEMETVEVTHSGIPDAGDQATGPTEMFEETGPAELVEGVATIRLAGRPPPPTTEPPLSEDQPTEQFPSEPTPARVVISGGVTPGPSIRHRATPAGMSRQSPPAARPRTQGPPMTGEGGWPAALAVLRAEVDAADPNERAPMCVAAGLMALRSAGQPSEAESWFAEAHAAGARDADFFRLWAETRGALGRWSDQESALLEVAERSDEPDRAEARLEAALVAWRRRQRPDAAVEFLALASTGLPEDYTSRALQRALLPSLGKGQLERRLQ
ncbi:MAG: hypothetical protein KC621_26235, partial [Myxococcales bacterium]|nr:hypothetical protein [Myxococcales bacterium]